MIDFAGWLPLVGVALGAGVAGFAATLAESRKFRRDFTVDLFRTSRDYFGRVLQAIDNQHRVVGQAAAAMKGERPNVAPDRIREADDDWAQVFALRGVLAMPNVQEALTTFDSAKAAVIDAINASDTSAVDIELGRLDSARVGVIDAMQSVLNAMTPKLALHVLPWRVRMWRRIRGQTLDYL